MNVKLCTERHNSTQFDVALRSCDSLIMVKVLADLYFSEQCDKKRNVIFTDRGSEVFVAKCVTRNKVVHYA